MAGAGARALGPGTIIFARAHHSYEKKNQLIHRAEGEDSCEQVTKANTFAPVAGVVR
jgi:hypothetical protein